MTTTDPAPTTAAPPDDVEETSSSPAGDATETTEASGPPEMPDEAKEDSESGAEAFALHYLEVFNYAAMTPEAGHLEQLASDDCATCAGFESMIAKYIENDERAAGPIVTVDSARAQATGDTTVVFAEAVQTVPATLDAAGAVVTASAQPTSFTMVLTLTLDGQAWEVAEIQVQQ
nr:DUF6318 family protein [Ornithinimicrobium cryptoxanthini]